MAITPFNQVLHTRPMLNGFAGSPSTANSTTVVGNTVRLARIERASADSSIIKIGFNVSVVTNTGDIDVRIESVDTATGFPSGTLLGTDSNATVTLGTTGWKTATLTTPVAVNEGDLYAIVITGLTSATDPNFAISVFQDDTLIAAGVPYTALYSAAAWAIAAVNHLMAVIYTGDLCYPTPRMWPCTSTFITATYDNTTSNKHRGNTFTPTIDLELCSVFAWVDNDAAFDIRVYDSDGTTVLSTTGNYAAVPPDANANPQEIRLAARATLVAGEKYYLVATPTTGSAIALMGMNFNSSNLRSILCADLVSVASNITNPTGPADWTENDTQMYFLFPAFSGADTDITVNTTEAYAYGSAS